VGDVTLDLVLDAQRRLAEAEISYYRSLVGYNAAITGIHFRKGSLLEYNGVCLAEGPWPGKAYFDAHRRAQARDASLYLDYGYTRPKVISRGVYEQHAGQATLESEMEEVQPTEAPLLPEEIPAPPGEPVETPKPSAAPERPTPSKADTQGKTADAARNTARPKTAEAPSGSVSIAAGSRRGGSVRKRAGYDLGTLDLSSLGGDSRAGKVSPKAAAKNRSIRLAAHQEADPSPASGGSDSSGLSWKRPKRSSSRHEPLANLPSAEADQPPASWKGVQR